MPLRFVLCVANTRGVRVSVCGPGGTEVPLSCLTGLQGTMGRGMLILSLAWSVCVLNV